MLELVIAVVTAFIIILLKLFGDITADAGPPSSVRLGGADLPDKKAPLTRLQRTVRRYGIVKEKKSFRDFCFPKSFSLQPQQKFVGEYMAPDGRPKELLLFHGIGSGKTRASIQIAEKYKHPIIVMPASLIPGYRNELRSEYLSPTLQAELADLEPRSKRYREIVGESDAAMDKKYQFYSYNKFATDFEGITGDIIIVDEVQNVSNRSGAYFKSLHTWLKSHPRASVVIMTATPIFNSVDEIRSIAELLRIRDDINDPSDIRAFDGKVSYYAGAPDSTYPEAKIVITKCKMSRHQAQWYNNDLAAEMKPSGDIRLVDVDNEFYSNTRQRANIAYPRGLTDEEGLAALRLSEIRHSLDKYSCKLAMIMRRLRRRKLAFIYSNYKGPGGVAAVVKCLTAWGYKDYFEHGPGPGRFAVWSGDTNDRQRDEIRAVFNSRGNDSAGKIAVVIGTPSVRAGISLLRVQQAHILEGQWNDPTMVQIQGRVNRFCSHKTLPPEKRTVKIYIYAAYVDRPEETPQQSIDLYMLKTAEDKKEEAAPWLQALMNIAVDRTIYYD